MRPSRIEVMMLMISIIGGKPPCQTLTFDSTVEVALTCDGGGSLGGGSPGGASLGACWSVSAFGTSASDRSGQGRESKRDGIVGEVLATLWDLQASAAEASLLRRVEVVENDEKEPLLRDALVVSAAENVKPCSTQIVLKYGTDMPKIMCTCK